MMASKRTSADEIAASLGVTGRPGRPRKDSAAAGTATHTRPRPKDADGEDMVSYQLFIGRETWRKVKIHCAVEDVTIRDWVTGLIEDAVKDK